MKRQTLHIASFLVLVLPFLMTGCSGSGNAGGPDVGETSVTTTGDTGSGGGTGTTPVVTTVTLTSSASSIGISETAALTATVKDQDGSPMEGVQVSFTLSGDPADATVTASATTGADGTASAVVTPGSTGGDATIVATASGVTSDPVTVTITLPTAASLSVTVLPKEITLNGQAVVTAVVTDKSDGTGNPIAGKTITFALSADSPTGSAIDPGSATTDGSGSAAATITPGSEVGTITVTATVDGLAVSDSVAVIPASSGSIAFVSAVPTLMGVTGSGLPETATVTFEVRDQAGQLVADGTTVTFELVGPGGGEALLETTAVTSGGQAAAVVTSGTVAGAVRVIARVTLGGNVFETASDNITVGSGPAAGNHVSLALVPINIAGRVRFGETSQITFFAADRFSNFVPEGSAPSFFSESGGIEPQGDGGTGSLGSVTVTLQSQLPTAADGISDILAYIVGEESFVDANGNGVFDFTDTNGNGVHDPGEASEAFFDVGEPFVDYNGNGTWDGDDPDTAADEAATDHSGDRTFDGAAQGVDADFNTSCPAPGGSSVPVSRGYFLDLDGDNVYEPGDLSDDHAGQYDPGSADVIPEVPLASIFEEGNGFEDTNGDCKRQGDEAFIDPSGDGRYYPDVDYTDLDGDGVPGAGEAFVQEPFFDGEQRNGRDGAYDGPNGSWDDRLFVSDHTTVIFSGPTTVVATPSSIYLDPGESVVVTIYVGDDRGHALASGSTVTIGKGSGSVGQMIGTGTFDIVDGSGTRFSVLIVNNVSSGSGGFASVTVAVDSPNGSTPEVGVAIATLEAPP